jgi:hypothetical protein
LLRLPGADFAATPRDGLIAAILNKGFDRFSQALEPIQLALPDLDDPRQELLIRLPRLVF